MLLFNFNFNADPLVKLLLKASEWWSWLAEVSFGSIIVRLLLAIVCGGILGVERASKRHAAGFRTYILVAVGSALAGCTNQFICDFFGSGDGARLGAQVISGIGFLCAGTILVTSRSQIKGLTTAAGLWACGCMGLSVGLGFYSMAIISCIVVLLVLSVLPPIENYFINRAKIFTVYVELSARTDLKELINHLRLQNYSVTNVEHNVAYASSGLSVYSVTISCPDVKNRKEVVSHQVIAKQLEQLPYVNHAEVIL